MAVANLHSKILDAHPPWGSKFFQFHAVFGKFWQNRMLAPPLGSWCPLLGEILDPPLNGIRRRSGEVQKIFLCKENNYFSRRRSGEVQKYFRCKENKCFSRKISGKVKKTFAAKRIIVSQGEEVEKFRNFFAAKRIIVSQ